ncbi:hypothetical protein B0H11DRAFT_1961815, partial [Mycena galericulata]
MFVLVIALVPSSLIAWLSYLQPGSPSASLGRLLAHYTIGGAPFASYLLREDLPQGVWRYADTFRATHLGIDWDVICDPCSFWV